VTTNLLIARETQVLRDIHDDEGKEAFDKAAVEYLAKIAAVIVNVDGAKRLHTMLDELKAVHPLKR
jgi:hypothetical protein